MGRRQPPDLPSMLLSARVVYLGMPVSLFGGSGIRRQATALLPPATSSGCSTTCDDCMTPRSAVLSEHCPHALCDRSCACGAILPAQQASGAPGSGPIAITISLQEVAILGYSPHLTTPQKCCPVRTTAPAPSATMWLSPFQHGQAPRLLRQWLVMTPITLFPNSLSATALTSHTAHPKTAACLQLVPAVTELILAEMWYLQIDDDRKPINLYINSTGTTRADGETVRPLLCQRCSSAMKHAFHCLY